MQTIVDGPSKFNERTILIQVFYHRGLQMSNEIKKELCQKQLIADGRPCLTRNNSCAIILSQEIINVKQNQK